MKDYKNRASKTDDNDDGFFHALGVISSFLIISIVIIACVFGAINEARAEVIENHYVVIGQSNAQGIHRHGDLDLLLSNDNVTAKLIDCTHSGKPIRKFLPNWNANTYYGDCVKKIGSKNVAGIIFWQGESESCGGYEWVAKWATMTRLVLLALKQDAGNLDIPIVMVILNAHKHPDRQYWQKIRSYQFGLVGRNIVKIDSTRYEYMPDNVHLTVNGYKEISKTIALKF